MFPPSRRQLSQSVVRGVKAVRANTELSLCAESDVAATERRIDLTGYYCRWPVGPSARAYRPR